MKNCYYLIFIVLLLGTVLGCNGSSETVENKSSGSDVVSPTVEDVWGDTEIKDAPSVIDTATNDNTEEPVLEATAPIDLKLIMKGGQAQNYRLTNSITTIVQSPNDPDIKDESTSFLNANQSVEVDDDKNVFIKTTGVEGGVDGEGFTVVLADSYMKKTVEAIEGSMLVAAYDNKGNGKNVRLIGGGIGLSPLGAQAGSQDTTIGFMGVLLPGKLVVPGDSWTGQYDLSQTAEQVFKDMGAKTTTGTIPLLYFLKGYDEERGLAQIGIRGAGNPIVDLPIGTAIAKIHMDITIEGEALVRLSDGWLYELRIQTDVSTEGFVATVQRVQTVTKLIE